MTNIDCGYAGYKTPKEIELEKENDKLKKRITELKVRLLDSREARDNATKVANTYLDQIADLSKKVEQLERQLESANKCIKIYAKWTNWLHTKPVGIHQNDYAKYYLEKWGVK